MAINVQIDGNHLKIEDVVSVARHHAPVELALEARERIIKAQHWVDEIVASNKPVYGINTGFGYFADRRIPCEDAAALSRNLILSHAVCTGPDLPKEVVRAAMLVRANTLAKGYSGVHAEIVDTLLAMLNLDLTPLIPSQGSLGSSGDLGPLSHLALVFTTDDADREVDSGWAEFQGKKWSGKAAMAAAGLRRLRLGAKEGLALNNGATFSAAIAAMAVYDASQLLDTAEVSLALSLEAMLGSSGAFDPRLHTARGHVGQIEVAEHIRQLVNGSTLIDAAGRVQDAYSLRCAPQVQGPARDTLNFVSNTIGFEINAATDNPLLFSQTEACSGGNFHGEPIGMAMDFLSIAMAEVGAISERRIFRLTDSKLNGNLPPMLVDNLEAAGLNSGLMMPQYTAAALALENQTLAVPDSVHSLPTSGEQEDHNANSMTAARHCRQLIENVAHIIAIEVYTAARALDLRFRQLPDHKMGSGTALAYQKVREAVAYQPGDAWWGPEIEKVHELIRRGAFAGKSTPGEMAR
jgi:histidine ammonia-lyase